MITQQTCWDYLCGQFNATAIKLMDGFYSQPSPQWVKGAFSQSFSQFLDLFRVSGWTAERYDCDNFSLFAYAYMQNLHNATQSLRVSPAKTGLAFAVMTYTQDIGQRHAVNVLLTGADARSMDLLVVEPQLGFQSLRLSRAEKQSVDLFLM